MQPVATNTAIAAKNRLSCITGGMVVFPSPEHHSDKGYHAVGRKGVTQAINGSPTLFDLLKIYSVALCKPSSLRRVCHLAQRCVDQLSYSRPMIGHAWQSRTDAMTVIDYIAIGVLTAAVVCVAWKFPRGKL